MEKIFGLKLKKEDMQTMDAFETKSLHDEKFFCNLRKSFHLWIFGTPSLFELFDLRGNNHLIITNSTYHWKALQTLH